MDKPLRHHFLPVFYLKRWAGPDGRIVEFSRPYGSAVKPRRTHPSGTGYVEQLYSFGGRQPDKAQLLEQRFFSPVDGGAADALTLLESGAVGGRWDTALRQAWVIFMTSLILRMPQDIVALKASYLAGWHKATPEQEAQYQAARGPNDPETAEEYFKSNPINAIENAALNLLPGLASRQGPSELLMNMHWFVLDAPAGEVELLTSDRPLFRSPLLLDDAYWQFPIGPRRMFWAVHEPKWEDHVRKNISSDWVRKANRELLRRASKYAYGRTDAALRFVQQNLSAEPLPSILQKITTKPDDANSSD